MQSETPVFPNHVGFIVDGNRRWAKKHGLPTYEGHLAGYNAIKEIIRASVEKGIKCVSFYVFSTENWKRSQDEVSYLMKLTLRILTRDMKELIKEKVKVKVLGSREGLGDALIKAINKAEADTAHFTRATVAVCLNYGGKQEIVEAAKATVADRQDLTEENIQAHLYAPEVPDLDMMVRTSGEQRISNFMLWRAAYCELMFLDKLWPDLRPSDIDDIIKEYARRNRRFGGN